MITAKSPDGLDILQASANTFYSNVRLSVEEFQEHYSLNSRLVKKADGSLVEDVYRAGTRTKTAGLRGISKAIECSEALPLAEPGQDAVLRSDRYYQTGEYRTG